MAMAMSVANLALLPAELLDMIAREIHALEKPTPHLSALSLSCRRLHQILEPALYQHIRFAHLECHNSTALPLYLLVRTILNRGELASHIQSIHLRGWSRNRVRRHLTQAKYTDDEYQMLSREKFSCGNYMHRLWIEGLMFGKADFFLAILLSRCKNLIDLDLDFHRDVSKSFAGLALTQSISTSTQKRLPCPKLRRVNFVAQSIPEDEMDGIEGAVMDINHVATIFNVYSPTEISASNIGSRPLTQRLPGPGRFISLTRLTLQKVWCRERDLEMLLAVNSQLRELVWERLCDVSFDPDPLFDCKTLEQALYHVKDTLTTLKISVEYVRDLNSDYNRGFHDHMEGRVESLRSFNRLQTLHIPAAVLMGWRAWNVLALEEQLPESLINFTLSDDTYEQFWNKLGFELPLGRLADYVCCAGTTARNIMSVELQTRYEDWVNAANELMVFWKARELDIRFSITKPAQDMKLISWMHNTDDDSSNSDESEAEE